MAERYERIYKIAWTNPYTEPEQPKTRVMETTKDAEIAATWTFDYIATTYGRGYGLCVETVDTKPRREISQEGKAKIRKARLTARITKKYPMFAETFIREEIERDPKYFSAETNERKRK